MIDIVEYKDKKKILVKFMENLQDYLIKIDPEKRLRRPASYGDIYVEELLRKVLKDDGKIYLAEKEGVPVGMIAGIIEIPNEIEEIDHFPFKTGNIIELIVDENCRGEKIGLYLMKKMEEYFLSKNCDTLWVDVFTSNQSAHEFYKKYGFRDRSVGMIKTL